MVACLRVHTDATMVYSMLPTDPGGRQGCNVVGGVHACWLGVALGKKAQNGHKFKARSAVNINAKRSLRFRTKLLSGGKKSRRQRYTYIACCTDT